MRAFARSDVDVVVLMVASQMGKTECGFNVLGWLWDYSPAPAIWVAPTMKLAVTLSRDRLNSMFQSVPGLWDRLAAEFRKPGSLERWIDGVRFGLAWAGSATELASHPCKYVIVDERSRMGADVGGEGDPVRLAMARTKMFHGSKVGVFSSPGEEGLCPTYRWWVTGSKLRWCWRCPECGEWLFPSLEHARFPKGASYETIRQEAWIQCPTCPKEIRDDERLTVEADYIPSTMDAEGQLTLAPDLETQNAVESYWATGFAGPTQGIGDIMEQYARADRDGDVEDVQAAVNTYAGELWKLPGQGATADIVKECQVDDIPDDEIGLITMGVDVQAESLYYVVRGWGLAQQSWLLDYGQLHGSTDFDPVYEQLADVTNQTFCGRTISLALIDSGYRTAVIYEFCRNHAMFEPAKGLARPANRAVSASKVDVGPTGRVRRTLTLWSIDTDHFKVWLYGRMLRDQDSPGAWHVPRGVSDDYCQQVTNERFRITRGRREWFRTGSQDNHYLDCEIYATAAANIRNIRSMKTVRPVVQAQPAPQRDQIRPDRQFDPNARRIF